MFTPSDEAECSAFFFCQHYRNRTRRLLTHAHINFHLIIQAKLASVHAKENCTEKKKHFAEKGTQYI